MIKELILRAIKKTGIFIKNEIFWIFALILFFITYFNWHPLLFLGLALISLSIHLFHTKTRYNAIFGIFIILFAVFCIILNFKIGWAGIYFSFFLILISCALNFSIKKEKLSGLILGLTSSMFFYVIAIKLSFPLISDALSSLYQKPLPVFNIIFLFVLSIFILLSFYILFRNLLNSFSRIPGFKKINNRYLAISLVIILVVILCGLWTLRVFYTNDYPFNISFSNSEKFNLIKDFSCRSLEGYVYYVKGDTIDCGGELFIKNNFSIDSISITKKEMNSPNWTRWEDLKFQVNNNTLYSFEIPIGESATQMVTIDILDSRGNVVHNENLRLKIYPFSQEEYKEKLRDRIGFIGSGFLLIIFAVFSAISNLKKILENETQITP